MKKPVYAGFQLLRRTTRLRISPTLTRRRAIPSSDGCRVVASRQSAANFSNFRWRLSDRRSGMSADCRIYLLIGGSLLMSRYAGIGSRFSM
jgi:hypothetical protein